MVYGIVIVQAIAGVHSHGDADYSMGDSQWISLQAAQPL